jgi:UDP-hydrolysing UDP-N-acetyl-D-glucosamine 2-epimerase
LTEQNGKPRRIATVLVDRANYGRMQPVMRAIAARPELELLTLAAGTTVLERFGSPVDVIRADGFEITSELFIELEGSTPVSMAKSVGLSTMEFAGEFQRLKPDIVLLIGDRYETLGAAVAAAYMNLTIVHIQGGEVSGSIDESARHAITKLSHFHFPATKRAAEYLVRMGEHPDTVLSIGCPSSDIAFSIDTTVSDTLQGKVNERGRGAHLDLTQPYQLVVFHPTTTEFGGERGQIRELLTALEEIGIPTLLLWPNIDAGSQHISKEVRIFRDHSDSGWFRNLTNLSPEDYLVVLANAACAIGNSSSFVRDASFLGTPVGLVGSRQDGRETAQHVVHVEPRALEIVVAVRQQIEHGPYPPSTLYGDGQVSPRIADAIVNLRPYVQKRLDYQRQDLKAGGSI